MHKLTAMGAALVLAGASLGAAAEDEAAAESPHVFSANVAMTTDYMFRGISQTNDGPAIQGGMDYSYSPVGFYAGAWASNVEFLTSSDRASMELDFYGGFAGSFSNGIGWDVGGIFYYYPRENEDSGPVGDYNYAEAYLKLSYAFEGSLKPTVEGGVAYSPDYFGEDGDGVYGYGTIGFTLPYDVGLSTTVGYLDVDGDKTYGAGYSYVHYSVGLSKAFGKFTASLSWNDANDDCGDEVWGGDDDLCKAVVFNVSSSW